MNSQCPVCLVNIAPPQILNAHVSNHQKEEIVAALLKQTTTASVPQVPISIPETPSGDLVDGATLQFEVNPNRVLTSQCCFEI